MGTTAAPVVASSSVVAPPVTTAAPVVATTAAPVVATTAAPVVASSSVVAPPVTTDAPVVATTAAPVATTSSPTAAPKPTVVQTLEMSYTTALDDNAKAEEESNIADASAEAAGVSVDDVSATMTLVSRRRRMLAVTYEVAIIYTVADVSAATTLSSKVSSDDFSQTITSKSSGTVTSNAATVQIPTTAPTASLEFEVVFTVLKIGISKELTPDQVEAYEKALEESFTKGLGNDLTATTITVDISSVNVSQTTANVSITSEVSNEIMKKLNPLLIGNQQQSFLSIVNATVMEEGLDEITIEVIEPPTSNHVPHDPSSSSESSSSPVASPTAQGVSSSPVISMYSTYFFIFGLAFSLL